MSASAPVERDLVTGLAGLLAAAGVATYAPTGVYTSSVALPAVVIGRMPEAPDRCIAFNVYAAVDEQLQNLTTYRVQVRIRGGVNDALDPADIAGSVFDVLHGITHVDLGSVHVATSRRLMVAPLGVDDSDRTERADSYELDVNTPTTPARPG